MLLLGALVVAGAVYGQQDLSEYDLPGQDFTGTNLLVADLPGSDLADAGGYR